MKFRKMLIALVAGALFLAVNGCSKDDDNKPSNNNSGSIEFLKVGNEWVYDYTAVDANGIVKYKILSKDDKGNMKVNWFMGEDFEIYWHESNGSFANLSEGPDGQKLIVYTKTCKVGDTWSAKGENDNGQEVTQTNKVVSISETVTTPAGTFNNCVKVHQTTTEDTRLQIDFYINPQYGIVKMDGIGSMSVNEGPTTYFPFLYILKSKNF